ncbi:MAG: GNAT family N-acetyltransferase, partial [Rhodospirillales bacterium]|nr:GNAT family N-acetyltransferase [Rhodospirillales bacterium]
MAKTRQIAVIRPAGPEDAGTILRLVRELAAYEGLLEQVRAGESDLLRDGFGQDPYFQCLLAEVDGEAVGFALFFYNYSTFEGRPGLYLEDLYV